MRKLLVLTTAAALTATVLMTGNASAASRHTSVINHTERTTTTQVVNNTPDRSADKSTLPQQHDATANASVMAAGGYTHYWGILAPGQHRLNLSGLPVTDRHPVVASPAQVNGPYEWLEFRLTIHNVHSWSNGVTVWLTNDAPHAIPINVHYIWS